MTTDLDVYNWQTRMAGNLAALVAGYTTVRPGMSTARSIALGIAAIMPLARPVIELAIYETDPSKHATARMDQKFGFYKMIHEYDEKSLEQAHKGISLEERLFWLARNNILVEGPDRELTNKLTEETKKGRGWHTVRHVRWDSSKGELFTAYERACEEETKEVARRMPTPPRAPRHLLFDTALEQITQETVWYFGGIALGLAKYAIDFLLPITERGLNYIP